MSAKIDFCSSITDESVMAVANLVNKYLRESINEIVINISSDGGSMTASLALYHFLKNIPAKITTNNYGSVGSGAILVYLAGQERLSESAAKFYIHQVRASSRDNLGLPALKELTDMVTFDIENYAKIFNERTDSAKGKFDVYYYLKNEALFLNPSSAYDCGLVTSLTL